MVKHQMSLPIIVRHCEVTALDGIEDWLLNGDPVVCSVNRKQYERARREKKKMGTTSGGSHEHIGMLESKNIQQQRPWRVLWLLNCIIRISSPQNKAQAAHGRRRQSQSGHPSAVTAASGRDGGGGRAHHTSRRLAWPVALPPKEPTSRHLTGRTPRHRRHPEA